jgi:hypothetical protein
MSELMRPSAKFTLLQNELLRLGTSNITEDDLVVIKGLIDGFLYNGRLKYEDEVVEEFGSTRDDFDEWVHDPGK